MADSMQKVTILRGEEEKLSILIPSNASSLSMASLSQHSLLYGRLVSGSSLQFGKHNIMMTTISMQSAVSPQSGFLDISAEQEGAWAIVKGHLAGDLYEAEIICVFSKAPTQKQWNAYREGTANLLEACQSF